ncbi:MAG: hypothetical protein IJ724_08160 [Muribaculaceae bacterium]|nr:hypothetical protein [Muribaculaceae bacterium]
MNYAFKKAWLHAAEAMALLAVATGAAWALPTAQAAQMTAALVVAYALPCWIYARSRHRTPAGRAVLLAAALWLAAIAIVAVWQATVGSGASFAMPQLYGDASQYYDWALAHYDGSAVRPKVTFWGYSLIIVALWRILGVSIIWPVAANVLVTLLTIVLTGHMAARLVATRQARTATLAMAMIAVQAYFMSQGAQMLKEPWIYLAVTLMAYSLMPLPRSKKRTANSGQRTVDSEQWTADSEERIADKKGIVLTTFNSLTPLTTNKETRSEKRETRSKKRETRSKIILNSQFSILNYSLLFALGCLLLAAVRAKYINFFIIAILLMAVANRFKQWQRYGALLAISLLCWWLGMVMTDHYTVVQQVNNVTGQGGMAAMFAPAGPYHRLLGDYFSYPVWQRLLHLPLTCAVQWIIPLPWLPDNAQPQWLSIVPRLRLGWYVLSGVVAYFYLFRSWRRGWSWMVWAGLPMMCYVGIAYITAGTVSRYILPFEPWWMTMAAATALSCWRWRSFRLFMATYVVLMAIVLAVCHALTH